MHTITEEIFVEMQKEMIFSLYGNRATPYRVDASYDALMAALKILQDKGAIGLEREYDGIPSNGQVIE